MSTNVIPRQPDDPGVSPANPYAPVTFRDSFAGRELAFFGAIQIGEVGPMNWGGLRLYEVRIDLPEVRPMFRADNQHKAKLLIANEVRDWVKRTPAPFCEAVR